MKNRAICTQNTILGKQIISITVVWEQAVAYKVLIEVTYYNQDCLTIKKQIFKLKIRMEFLCHYWVER